MSEEHHRKRRRLSSPKDNRDRRGSTRHHDHTIQKAVRLPYEAKSLQSRDLNSYTALFSLYLDVHKKLDIETLSREELKGRFKSFVGKWNRGELAEGWYDPAMKQRSDDAHAANEDVSSARRPDDPPSDRPQPQEQSDVDDVDEYGPAMTGSPTTRRKPGPTIARLDDTQNRNEQRLEDKELRRDDLRYERKQERKLQKERLDEIVPRAEPGTRERQLEKKREVAVANRSFREAKEPEVEEVGDSQLMGDNGVGVEGYKAKMQAMQRKKSEREMRKEETLRARAAEREEKLSVYRAKEEKTMEMLRALAKQKYG